jgi:hypothetical protein
MRRLLSAFSIRPTIISINRIWGLFNGVQFGYTNPLDIHSISKITRIPMITLRLPLNINNGNTAVHLDEALSQTQLFVENKTIVPKAMQLIHSDEVIVFYIPRRFQTVNMIRNIPCHFSSLPMTVAGWEQLNDHPVNFDFAMTLFNEVYNLRSVVLVESSAVNKNLIIGSSAAILVQNDISTGYYDSTCLLYDPQGANEIFKYGDGYGSNGPITVIPTTSAFNAPAGIESFAERARKRGTVFIYQKKMDEPCIPSGNLFDAI